MQNLENLDVFEILITHNLLNARRTLLSDPRSYKLNAKRIVFYLINKLQISNTIKDMIHMTLHCGSGGSHIILVTRRQIFFHTICDTSMKRA